ncbi:carbohydrate-binding module family 50 protein [Melanomma pulvis-pyrius CBS 109.77]|uniref:Carbohydrate-binding module family 50 protein n=1 Tax=Melanomma pulvis-pyrius CBS 109.77 TaxID=1314802 RepID=A0A6A6XA04_9PLEO|nr:carbohydrate-binding module family 50 protein [Melanomma pulvis-pyrius CBS 109.77]
MVSFTITVGIALLASISSVAAAPFSSNGISLLDARQEELPPTCSDYCSVSAGCVCIIRPTNCVATYIVDSGETCGTVVDRFDNFTATALFKWNPEIGKECFGLHAYVPVCIGVTGYQYPGAVEGGDTWTPEQTPVPVQPGIVTNCTKFEYTDSQGSPTLATILSSNNITKEQWNSWNVPTQDPTQDWASWAGYFSCVEA